MPDKGTHCKTGTALVELGQGAQSGHATLILSGPHNSLVPKYLWSWAAGNRLLSSSSSVPLPSLYLRRPCLPVLPVDVPKGPTEMLLWGPRPGPTQPHPAPTSADLNPFFVLSSLRDSSCFRRKWFTSGRAVEYVCFSLCSPDHSASEPRCIWGSWSLGFWCAWGGSHFLLRSWLVCLLSV